MKRAFILSLISIGSVATFLGGCTTFAKPQANNQSTSTATGTLSYSCAPWDGAAIQLDIQNNTHQPFPKLTFNFYNQLENFRKPAVKNIRYRFVAETESLKNGGAAFYKESASTYEYPAVAEVTFETLSNTGVSTGYYKIKLKNKTIESQFKTAGWLKQAPQLCG
ncbi:MAG: hypothetical protein H2174_10070 [Vampirovibrio sp.]|nr:hypothetical protein [Vampirovibrio sp.]